MNAVAGILAVALLATMATLAWRERGRRRAARMLKVTPRRILLPFIGHDLSQRGLDAALRIARNDGATLVPAYLARVPRHLPLDIALPRQSSLALPLLEAIEHRAAIAGVPVDSRIERGRTYRHAVRELTTHEDFETIVLGAVESSGAGFHSDDIGWLLENIPGEIIVVRPGVAIPLFPAPAHRRRRIRGALGAQARSPRL